MSKHFYTFDFLASKAILHIIKKEYIIMRLVKSWILESETISTNGKVRDD